MSGNSSSSDRQAVSVPPQWEAAADSVAYDSSSDPPPVIVVCGPGNSGKSLFSRTLLNNLLKRYKKVGYLDTDVGQPEFNTPGCVSLHIIDKPTPDLTILCLKTPEKCFFYGDVNCQKDKNVYLNSILSLYDYFHEEFYQPNEINDPGRKMMPLVVNTSGWVKGAGYDLLVKMLRHISPTHVVQIRVSAESKNLPKGLFWLDENHQRSSNSIEICAAVKDSSSVSMRKDAAHVLRDVRIIAYFRQCLPRELAIATYKDHVRNLASAPAHEISLSRIRVIELHCEGNDNISHSLKAKIVGLGISASVLPSPENASPNCVGLARDIQKADPKWRIILLRYFNPVGAHESGHIGEDPIGIPNNLMPYIQQVVVGRLPELNVYGHDYPTKDGSAIRDYIHVMDLADGHIAALRKLFITKDIGCVAYNLGNGCGTSMLEMVSAFEKASGKKIPIKLCPRRPGDATAVYASTEKALKELGWKAKYGTEEMCRDQWMWASKNPHGYRPKP